MARYAVDIPAVLTVEIDDSNQDADLKKLKMDVQALVRGATLRLGHFDVVAPDNTNLGRMRIWPDLNAPAGIHPVIVQH